VVQILGLLKNLAKRLSTEEFPLDAAPMPVLQGNGSNGAAQPSVAVPTNGATPSAEAPVQPSSARRDILSSFGALLIEQSRLEKKLAEEVKPAGASDDEFGRFARKAVALIDAMDRLIQLSRDELAKAPEFEGWCKAVEAANERMLRLFDNHGLSVMTCMGQAVDFNVHDVIEYRRTNAYPHDSVIEEIRKGVTFRGQVIRDAKVVIACNDSR
jgi:molecular chaperone GrpE (heat shock protein)